MKYLLCAASAAAFLASAAPAQVSTVEDVPVNQLIVYGDDPCPASTEEIINVCARVNEDERFRIPDRLRDNPNDPANDSWSNRARELEYVGRSGIGSCSPTGPGGMIGCYNQLVRQARAERAGRDSVNWDQLIEEARQERLGRIDAESEAIEEEVREREGQAPR